MCMFFRNIRSLQSFLSIQLPSPLPPPPNHHHHHQIIIIIITKPSSSSLFSPSPLFFFLTSQPACDCDATGSRSTTECKNNGGQCACKDNVTGRRCNMCKRGFYGFSATGCKREWKLD